MSNAIQMTGRIAKHLTIDVPVEIVGKLWGKGPVTVLNNLVSLQSFQPITKINEVVIPIFQAYCDTNPVLKPFAISLSGFAKANKCMNRASYGTAAASTAKEWVDKDGNLKLPKKLSTSFLFGAALADLGMLVINDLKLAKPIETLLQVSSHLGKVKIGSYFLVRIVFIRGFCIGLKEIKESFVIMGSVASSWEVIQTAKQRRDNVLANEGIELDFIQTYLQTEDVLKHATNMGKIVFSLVGFMYGGALWFRVSSFGCNILQLTAVAIKEA